jgi:hypothetical protein
LSDYSQAKSSGTWPAVTNTSGQGTSQGLFGLGQVSGGGTTNITNVVGNTGVVLSDVTSTATSRDYAAGLTYGGDKGIYVFGTTNGTSTGNSTRTTLISNTGTTTTDATTVGTAKSYNAGASYGTNRLNGIVAYGLSAAGAVLSLSNLISSVGVLATDVTGVGQARLGLAAATYGTTGQCVFGYGSDAAFTTFYSFSNKVSNVGVVAANTTGVGTARYGLAAATYGTTGQAIFGYGSITGGSPVSVTNLVTSAGAFASDVTGVGTARRWLAATAYGNSKAVFGYGVDGAGAYLSITNLISTTGVVATDTTGVGTARFGLSGAGFAF